VPGRRWLLDHPNPDRSSLLAWEPRYADVARSGDFGWTTGPFEFRPDRNAATIAGSGNFLTVWRRRADGTWKALFDGGNGEGPWTLTRAGWGEWTAAPPAEAGDRFPSGPSATASLLAVDSAIGRPGREGAPNAALIARLDDHVRIYRPGAQALIGRDAAAAALERFNGSVTSRPIGSAMASSGDLAFTYGDYQHAAAGAAGEKGLYVRLWRRDGAGAWRVAFDVLFPQRPPR
jgi:ketosteroid isomerase-like protein